MYVDLAWLLEFVQFVGELKSIYDALVALVEQDPPVNPVPLTDEQRLQALKDATLLVHKLRLDIACFPLTDSAVVFYGADEPAIPLEC